MNQRIRQLWQQAVLNNTKTPMNFQDAADEFAELIIQESIGVMVKNDYHGKWLGEKIKEHFGVE